MQESKTSKIISNEWKLTIVKHIKTNHLFKCLTHADSNFYWTILLIHAKVHQFLNFNRKDSSLYKISKISLPKNRKILQQFYIWKKKYPFDKASISGIQKYSEHLHYHITYINTSRQFLDVWQKKSKRLKTLDEREKHLSQLLHPTHIRFNPGSSTPRLAHNRLAFNYHCTRELNIARWRRWCNDAGRIAGVWIRTGNRNRY